MSRTVRWILAWACLVLLAGCAASPNAPASKQASDTLLEGQLAAARQGLAAGQPPRLVLAGFAMHSESKAFRGDVQLAEQVMRGIDPQAVVFRLANPAFGQGADWPFATRENVASVLQAIGALARPSDKVVLLFASHGNRQVLGVNAASQDLQPITAPELQQWLVPLRGRPTLLLLSACHSGSFIPLLRGPSRIILAAAAADRSSFGCQFQSGNTFFIEELLRQDTLGQRSVMDLMQGAREGVQRREAALKLEPSLPQSFVGPAAEAWSRQPLSQWLRGAP